MKKLISLVLLASPVAALAQTHQVTEINSLVNYILQFGNVVIYVLVALAVVFIVYNIVMYIVRGASAEGKSEALKNIGWGILGLAIIVSIWGLVGILTRSVVTTPTNQPLPNVSNSTGVGGIPGNQVPVLP